MARDLKVKATLEADDQASGPIRGVVSELKSLDKAVDKSAKSTTSGSKAVDELRASFGKAKTDIADFSTKVDGLGQGVSRTSGVLLKSRAGMVAFGAAIAGTAAAISGFVAGLVKATNVARENEEEVTKLGKQYGLIAESFETTNDKLGTISAGFNQFFGIVGQGVIENEEFRDSLDSIKARLDDPAFRQAAKDLGEALASIGTGAVETGAGFVNSVSSLDQWLRKVSEGRTGVIAFDGVVQALNRNVESLADTIKKELGRGFKSFGEDAEDAGKNVEGLRDATFSLRDALGGTEEEIVALDNAIGALNTRTLNAEEAAEAYGVALFRLKDAVSSGNLSISAGQAIAALLKATYEGLKEETRQAAEAQEFFTVRVSNGSAAFREATRGVGNYRTNLLALTQAQRDAAAAASALALANSRANATFNAPGPINPSTLTGRAQSTGERVQIPGGGSRLVRIRPDGSRVISN